MNHLQRLNKLRRRNSQLLSLRLLPRCLMEQWRELVRDKDEQTYYYDSDGDIRYCWMDAEYDFGLKYKYQNFAKYRRD